MNREPISQELSFDEALSELQPILAVMESGKAPLEEVVALARRGEELVFQCTAKIAKAERLVEELTITPDGELVTQPLDYEEDADEELT